MGRGARSEKAASAAPRAAAPDRYALQAAIAAEHVADATDWSHVAALYARLAALDPSPVIELNRAVAVAMAEGPAGRAGDGIDAIAGSTATTCCTPRAPTCCGGSGAPRRARRLPAGRSRSPSTRSSATFLERRLSD